MTQTFDALVMAGGKGTRLLPYTTILPKPLMPLGDAPVLEFLLRRLHDHGVRNVCLAVNHLHHLIEAFFGDGRSLDLRIEYVVENKPLGTCGPASQVLDRMVDAFLLLNGDLVTDLDLTALLEHHRANGAAATVATMRRTTQIEYGVVDADPAGRITGLREKPTMDHSVIMGVYVLDREAIRPFLTPGEALDMPDLLTAMIAAGLRVNAYFADCQWIDIGRPDDYERAQSIVLARTALPAAYP